MSQQTVYVKNDNLLRLTGLKKLNGIDYENAATVTVTVRNRNGVSPEGENFPIAMTYVPESNGDYTCVLYNQINWELNEPYIAEISAVAGGITSLWEMRLVARRRPITV